MIGIDPSKRDFNEMYRLMTTAVVPRPIGWISTTDPDGVDNLAPFSHFNTVSPNPPVVMFSVGYRDAEDEIPKDTVKNVLETDQFVVNLVTESLAEQMDQTSAPLDPDQSEFDFADIKRGSTERVMPPRVAAAAVSLECSLYDYQQVFDNTMILGVVEYIHLDESVTTDGKIDMRKVDAVGRLGGPYYTTVDVAETIKRQY